MTDANVSLSVDFPPPVAAVVPRRPLRPNPTSAMPRVEWRARPVTVANLFLDVFGTEDPAPQAPLSARERGRARMQALATAREIAAAPALHNLWHDAFDDTDGLPEPANDTVALPSDERMVRVRSALYSDMDGPVAPVRDTQSVQMRLAVQAMNGTLIVVAAPVGAAVLTYSLFRGEDLRLTGNALAVCGAIMAIVQTGLNFV